MRGDAHVGVRVRPWAGMCVCERACARVGERARQCECLAARRRARACLGVRVAARFDLFSLDRCYALLL